VQLDNGPERCQQSGSETSRIYAVSVVTIQPSPSDLEKFRRATSDCTLASAAIDALMNALPGGDPVQYYVSAVQSGIGQPVPWPGHLQLGWTNARGDRGMSTKRRAIAKGWMLTAYRAGLSVQLHSGPGSSGITLGTLKQIRDRYVLASSMHARTVAMLPQVFKQHVKDMSPAECTKAAGYATMRAAVHKVAEQISKETALGILRDRAGAQMITAVHPQHYDGVTAACERALRGIHEPSDHTYSTAFGVEHRTFAITAFPNQPAGSAVLTSDCPATGEHSVIAVFNNRAQAEAIKNLLSTSDRLTASK
jgi:hypothetical protein